MEVALSVLGAVLTVVAVLLGLLALLLLAVVVIPFGVRAAGSAGNGEARAWARVWWAAGALAVTVSVPRGVALELFGLRAWRGRLPSGGKRDEAKHKKRREQKRRPRARRARWRALLRLALRLAAKLALRLRVEGVIGLPDPADTAVVIASLRQLERLPGVEVAVEPSWVDEEIAGDVELSARIWVLHLLVTAAWMLTERETRRALFAR